MGASSGASQFSVDYNDVKSNSNEIKGNQILMKQHSYCMIQFRLQDMKISRGCRRTPTLSSKYQPLSTT